MTIPALTCSSSIHVFTAQIDVAKITFEEEFEDHTLSPNLLWLCNHYTLTITQIVGFLILARGVITSKFVIYEQLFNPILSDSFGFTVKQTSYFFLLLLPATIIGAFSM